MHFTENDIPAEDMLTESHFGPRRSDRAQKGQGGHLERLQAVSEAVQQMGTRKRRAGPLNSIPEAVPDNPMAPQPKTKKRRTAKGPVSTAL
jgi:hypothetical protein